VTVVSDSSPIVILTKLGSFDLLNRLFPCVYISAEVHHEVVVAGAGLPGAAEVSNAKWIEVKQLQNRASLLSLVLLDDYKARKLAKAEGLKILGSVGLLEAFYARGYLTDLRACFRRLMTHNVYIDQRLLNRRLRTLGLPRL
jgi:predicted nucleic acid-binding protein